MASFSAELRVAGHVIPLIGCRYAAFQSTGERGRVNAKVRRVPVEAEADVPAHQVLEAWAADAHKRQEAVIVFRNADTGATWETLHLPAAYCTRYDERFVNGDITSGSYRCYFTLSDPDGWTLHAGGPLNPSAVRPAAGEHGSPALALTAATALVGSAAEQVRRLPRITGRPPFTVKGPQNGKPGLDRAEFTRQLSGQEAGLNRLTVAQFLANRDQYLKRALHTGDGRDPTGDAAQQLARAIALRRKADELQISNEDLTPDEAEAQARQWLDTQAALHDPDQVAGGHPHLISGVGEARVNSSIGAQWPKRIKGIDSQIRKQAAGMTPQERENTYLNIELPMA